MKFKSLILAAMVALLPTLATAGQATRDLDIYAISDTTLASGVTGAYNKNGMNVNALSAYRQSISASSSTFWDGVNIATWDTLQTEAIGVGGADYIGLTVLVTGTAAGDTAGITQIIPQISNDRVNWRTIGPTAITAAGADTLGAGVIVTTNAHTGNLQYYGKVWHIVGGVTTTTVRPCPILPKYLRLYITTARAKLHGLTVRLTTKSY